MERQTSLQTSALLLQNLFQVFRLEVEKGVVLARAVAAQTLLFRAGLCSSFSSGRMTGSIAKTSLVSLGNKSSFCLG